MTILYTRGSIEIKKSQTYNKYQITNNSYILQFFKIVNLSHTKEKKGNDNVVEFSAESVQTLSQFLNHEKSFDYQTILFMLHNIGKQLLHLEENNKGILFFDLEDIIVINDNTFVFINVDKILESKNRLFTLMTPIQMKSLFLSPELKGKLTLPLEIYNTSSYYSLALLLIYCLYGTTFFTQNIQNIQNIQSNKDSTKKFSFLDAIFSTNLYYFLIRCLKLDPYQRKFIYI
jgi:hypothetical protein